MNAASGVTVEWHFSHDDRRLAYMRTLQAQGDTNGQLS